MKLIPLPFPSITNPVAVVVIQPESSNSVAFTVQPFTFIFVFVRIYYGTTTCVQKWHCLSKSSCSRQAESVAISLLAFSLVVLPATTVRFS